MTAMPTMSPLPVEELNWMGGHFNHIVDWNEKRRLEGILKTHQRLIRCNRSRKYF